MGGTSAEAKATQKWPPLSARTLPFHGVAARIGQDLGFCTSCLHAPCDCLPPGWDPLTWLCREPMALRWALLLPLETSAQLRSVGTLVLRLLRLTLTVGAF